VKPRSTVTRLVRTAAWLAAIGSVTLLTIALLGDFTGLGHYKVYQPKHWDSLDPELVERVRDRGALIAEARQRLDRAGVEVSERTLMNALYLVTIDRFVHGAAEHTPFTNWVVWTRGLLRPHPFRLRDTNELLKRGHAALCGQVSQLLADTAREMGIEARIIQLGGHVVMEASFDGDWHMYDANAEVGPRDWHDALPSADELIAEPARLRALYEPNNPQMVPVFLHVEANWIGDLDESRVWLEAFGSTAKYAFPVLMLLVTVFLLRATRP
jgi:hypothetical protein